jgi:uncharacterized spore protein YtfJ
MTTALVTDNDILQTLRNVVDNATPAMVFGTPISQDGVIVLPAAKVSSSGGGAGNSTAPAQSGQKTGGTGRGIGQSAKALGVFVIKDGKVSWRPAIDVNKVILGGQIIAVAALLFARALIKQRRAGGRDV